MPNSALYDILTQSQAEILKSWVAQQLKAVGMRADLINEADLTRQSSDFLHALVTALKSGESSNIKSPAWTPVVDQLTELTSTRSRIGFSPSETASFILSLRLPVTNALRKQLGSGDANALFDEVTVVSDLLDKLSLVTVEAYQQTREDLIKRQQFEMLELSTPVVKLWDGIVGLPLIGTLDSARTNVVMENLLQQIVDTESEIAIIDITGVPTVDTLVAQHLLKTVAAARLMGADCIISGIRPQIAQTMVHLGIDLTTVITKATLAEALRVALTRTGFRVTRDATPAKSAQ